MPGVAKYASSPARHSVQTITGPLGASVAIGEIDQARTGLAEELAA